jgi:hypothetical protein
MLFYLIIFLVVLFFASLRQVNQYERGVKLTMGRFSNMVDAGWRVIIPVFQSMQKVDLRLKAVDVPAQDAITKDNVSAKINAVIYYKVVDAAKAVLEVENFNYAVLQLAQTTMRNIVGEVTLDELLSQRQVISDKIEKIVDAATLGWGVEVVSVELKDINLPPDMVRTIAKQAEAERERRAVIINSEGEVTAAENLARAASILSGSNGALHLRTLNSINDISSDQPTIINKLRLNPSMKLARMQDIGGVRAVLKTIKDVRDLEREYRNKSHFKHELVNEKDYIESPKNTGYRGIHLIYKYKNNRKKAKEYNGLLLELQIRTRLQHAWATAVETMGTFLGQPLKSMDGDKKWFDFFCPNIFSVCTHRKI